MPSLYIIRGVPGSGKSTLGNRLKVGGLVRWSIAADDWMVDDSGSYDFDFRRLSYCHQECRSFAFRALASGESVAVCNTFTTAWEMQPYIDMADQLGVTKYVLVCEGRFENVHGVPGYKVEQMRERFEFV